MEHTVNVYNRSRFQSHPKHTTAIQVDYLKYLMIFSDFFQGENITMYCGAQVDANLLDNFKIIWRLNREPILLPQPTMVIN